MTAYQVTGNEYISLPTIRESDGAIEGITFLMMSAKGMLEMRGGGALIAPFAETYGLRVPLSPVWTRGSYWLPSFESESGGLRLRCTYLTPLNERAFGIRLCAENTSESELSARIGLSGEWKSTLHEVNESVELADERRAKLSGWNHMFVFSQRSSLPLFSFAPIASDDQPFSGFDQGAEWSLDGFSYEIWKAARPAPGGSVTLDVFFGLGYEEVAAATSAKELLRQGFDALYARTLSWLNARVKHAPDAHIARVMNENLFFSYFYASGRAMDTEEYCMMTSRSPRYYVSAAYWDRDSLLWAFPAILETDAICARELIMYAFTRQARNFGVHSRYIDGTVLEPGFELDELCAPVIALSRYIERTGDSAIAQDPDVRRGLNGILERLSEKRHPEIPLYETFLMPTDDLRVYPYLTYDNALAVCALRALSGLLDRPELLDEAEAARRAIYERCTREEGGKRFFVWSTDLEGNFDIYDEPPGSLLLLPFYGLCDADDEVWRNTASMIRDASYPLSFAGCPIAEIGCAHAPHPWVLSICVSLLSGRGESALRHLRLAEMDNGLACESVNERTGLCETGAAFATCAGFLAYSLMRYFQNKN